MFTSGSTGAPKGVVLSRRAVLGNARRTAVLHGLTPDRPHGTCLPLHHCNALVMSLLGTHLTGTPLTLHPAFDPAGYFAALDASGARTASIVPALLTDLIEAAPPWPARAGIPDHRRGPAHRRPGPPLPLPLRPQTAPGLRPDGGGQLQLHHAAARRRRLPHPLPGTHTPGGRPPARYRTPPGIRRGLDQNTRPDDRLLAGPARHRRHPHRRRLAAHRRLGRTARTGSSSCAAVRASASTGAGRSTTPSTSSTAGAARASPAGSRRSRWRSPRSATTSPSSRRNSRWPRSAPCTSDRRCGPRPSSSAGTGRPSPENRGAGR
ncbi:2-succinylbenzoate--CoA ligase [Streptomyces antimycoticus]